MTHLTADSAMLAVLSQAKELAEIRDASGKIIGYFAPVSAKDPQRQAQAAARLDRADLERRWATERGQGRTTREVFEHLLSLTPDPQTQAYLREKIAVLAERERCDTP